MTNLFILSSTLGRLHPQQAENGDGNLRLVVDEDDDGKFRLQRDNDHPPQLQFDKNIFMKLTKSSG